MVQDKNSTAKRTPLLNVLVAVAAGAAGALLFLLAARGTWAGMILSYFAPLPVMIATLGFGLVAGAIAVVSGALVAGASAALSGSVSGTIVSVGVAVGAGLLLPAYLVCLAALRAPEVPPDDRRVPRAVLAAVVFAAGSAIAILVSLIMEHGGATNARNAITAAILPLLCNVLQENRLPGNITAEELARAIVGVAPAIVAASSLFMLVVNAYIAGRVAMISGQLARPWPLVADTLALPAAAAALFALSCGLVFLGGTGGVVASIVASALGCGFALEGLAVAHALSRGRPARTVLLTLLYALIVCLPPWPLVILALVGFFDAAFHLRRRRAETLANKKP